MKILRKKLNFVLWFFDESTRPFFDTVQRTEANDRPSESRVAEEDDCFPRFFEEWLRAKEAIELQGQLALNIVQRSFREYLDDTVLFMRQGSPSTRGNWFINYSRWFGQLGIDWSLSNASLSLIEEITTARNRIQHGSPNDSRSLIKCMDQDYAKRFQNAQFTNSLEVRIFGGGVGPKLHSIEVTKEKLGLAVEEILKLSDSIDQQLSPFS